MYSVLRCHKESGMAKYIRRLKPAFDDTLAREGYSVRAFARFASVPHQTLFALIHPEYQAKYRSLGGMHKRTAWRLAYAFARATGLTDDEAYGAIIVEQLCSSTEPLDELLEHKHMYAE